MARLLQETYAFTALLIVPYVYRDGRFCRAPEMQEVDSLILQMRHVLLRMASEERSVRRT